MRGETTCPSWPLIMPGWSAAPPAAAPAVRALIQKQRDALEEMSDLMKQIDASHIRYRKRAVQRAQFLLLSDRSSQGSVTALLRRYAEDIRHSGAAVRAGRWPGGGAAAPVPGGGSVREKSRCTRPPPRTAEPLAPVRAEPI